MRVRVLGCSGAIAQGNRTTSFLVDDRVLIDAGTGVGDLTLEEMVRIDHVALTHAHLDHVAALPLMLDAVAASRIATGRPPLTVHALPATLDALRAHIFNDLIWPDFSVLPSREHALMRYQTLEVGDRLEVGSLQVEVLPAVHTVAAVGYAIRGDSGHWVFSGDTGHNPAFWDRINTLQVALLVIETAFSERERDLARRSLHLSPSALAAGLDLMRPDADYPIYITHTKPAETQHIMAEITHLNHERRARGLPSHRIGWLASGQSFDL